MMNAFEKSVVAEFKDNLIRYSDEMLGALAKAIFEEQKERIPIE